MNGVTLRTRIAILLAAAAACFALVFSLDPVAQDLAYHDFADKRGLGGIPNFGDVAGNLPFIGVGIAGIIAVWRRRKLWAHPAECWLWTVFFTGIFLVGFGSGYYHWAPENATLVWDRLPMTIGFMSLFSLMICERISLKAGLLLFPLFLAAGIGSIWYWNLTESVGQGDLRPYALVQFFPMVAILLILWLFPSSGTRYFVLTLVWYVLAKLLEHFDREFFDMTGGIVSGHTLKHLAAAVSTGWMVEYVRKKHVISKA